jgi:predicted N-acetyltransferase YhbS
MTEGLARAKAQGWRAVVLVGDEPYYARFGFSRQRALKLCLPGPVDAARLLALDLVEAALDDAAGMI